MCSLNARTVPAPHHCKRVSSRFLISREALLQKAKGQTAGSSCLKQVNQACHCKGRGCLAIPAAGVPTRHEGRPSNAPTNDQCSTHARTHAHTHTHTAFCALLLLAVLMHAILLHAQGIAPRPVSTHLKCGLGVLVLMVVLQLLFFTLHTRKASKPESGCAAGIPPKALVHTGIQSGTAHAWVRKTAAK
jgi:hypothetical protein